MGGVNFTPTPLESDSRGEVAKKICKGGYFTLRTPPPHLWLQFAIKHKKWLWFNICLHIFLSKVDFGNKVSF